jgi:predicted amidophosphoribosyltransferase
VRGLVAAYDYRGPVAAAVVTAKVRGARAGWASLGALLATHVAAAAPTVDAVTWVTTAPARRRLRGVDHAAVLARHVARALGLPAVEALRVTREGGEERFVCRSELPGTDLLLVDDVVTTGTTARRAAEALVAGGAAPPWIAALARAGAHPLGERL